MFPRVWSSLLTVKMAALGTLVSLVWVILDKDRERKRLSPEQLSYDVRLLTFSLRLIVEMPQTLLERS